jgi:hypothetical protein
VFIFRVLRGLRSNGPTGRFTLAPMVSTGMSFGVYKKR